MRAYAAAGLLVSLWATIVPHALLAQAPVLPPNSVVNGASFRAATDPNGAIAPGTIVSVFGTNLASATLEGMTVPLSTRLPDAPEGSSVIFRVGSQEISAPLFFVSSGQVNAQAPFELPTGTVMVRVRRGSESSAEQPVQVAAVSPGIFPFGNSGAILHAATFQLVTESDPARPGEFLLIFCTGLGAVQPSVPSGQRAPSMEPLARTVSTPLVNIASPAMPAQVTFSGLAPGFVGLYQVNVQVPAGVPAGPQPLQIIINGVPSNTVTLPVAQ